MRIYPNLSTAIAKARETLINTGYEIHTESWQSTDIKDKVEMVMWETLFYSFMAPIPYYEADLAYETLPNLPWADIHFEERVSGKPLNPGESYKDWPFYKMDAQMRTEGELFSHTYMERFWPRYAGEPWEKSKGRILHNSKGGVYPVHSGIRYSYGDLENVINLLKKEPDTRQAYLPIWFPEDTGNKMNKRVPCSLGYHFIRRKGKLHMEYNMRSCDFRRHFRDDIYLACRLLLWILIDKLGNEPDWQEIEPGYLKMDITSLHCFKQELKYI